MRLEQPLPLPAGSTDPGVHQGTAGPFRLPGHTSDSCSTWLAVWCVLVMWNGKCDKGKGKVMAIQIAGSPWFWCCSYTDMVFPSSMLLFHPLQRKLLKTHEKCLGLGKIRGGWEECGWWCWGLSIAKVVEMSCEGAIESWWQWLGRKWKGGEDGVPGNEPGGTRSLASSGEGKGLVQISKSSMSHASTPQKHIHFSILQGRTSRG